MKIKGWVFMKKISMIESSFLKHRIIHFSIDEYVVEGQCINYNNLLIVNEMSKCVRDKYYKEQSTYQYYMGSIVWLSLYNLSDSIDESRVIISLAFYMFFL